MRLIDLEPRWIGFDSAKFGLTFLCPKCGQQRLAVMFKPYIDPLNIVPLNIWKLPDAPDPNTGEVKAVNWWQRTGEDFETLTLAPSVDASANKSPFWEGTICVEGHWHGHIRNGQVSS
ncbi:MAG TPA: hypothetical protein VMS08_00955 [Candidatus Saccharimonadia bacterium]|nr:hypothetical protein [Candidatus Saccharimonadia bacterium]